MIDLPSDPKLKSTGSRLGRFAAASVFVFLLLSVILNFMLYKRSMEAYIELQRLRLDPTDAKAFDADNQRLEVTRRDAKRVVMFGDSRIAMWYPEPHISGCQWVNRGVGGQTTAQLLQRLDRDVIALHPDLVLVEMGVNNLKTIGVFPDQEGEIVKSCNRDTDLILQRLSDHNIPVAMLTIFPAGSVPFTRRSVWSDRTRDAIVAYNQRLATLKMPGLSVIDCDPSLSVGGRMNPRYASETLHVNEAGYVALDRLIEPTLNRLLGPPGLTSK